jgi:hypothetical protein
MLNIQSLLIKLCWSSLITGRARLKREDQTLLFDDTVFFLSGPVRIV